MLGGLILCALWFGFGLLGAIMACRGSRRRYGRVIYTKPHLIATVVFGIPGFLGSVVAW